MYWIVLNTFHEKAKNVKFILDSMQRIAVNKFGGATERNPFTHGCLIWPATCSFIDWHCHSSDWTHTQTHTHINRLCKAQRNTVTMNFHCLSCCCSLCCWCHLSLGSCCCLVSLQPSPYFTSASSLYISQPFMYCPLIMVCNITRFSFSSFTDV